MLKSFFTAVSVGALILVGCGGGESGNGDCGGPDCCEQAGDCPASYSVASSCRFADGVSDCQGTRWEARCEENVCVSIEVADDSGCAGLTLDCPDHLAPVTCTAEEDQAVAACKQLCEDNQDCLAPFECNPGNGACECPGGDLETECDDSQDNDCDGLTDCNDGDCAGDPPCAGSTGETICDDGVDNDSDGRTDCGDTDCAVHPDSCGLELIGGVYIGRKTIDNGNYDESYLVIWPFYEFPMPGLIVFFTYLTTGRWQPAYQAGDCVFYDQLPPGFCSGGCNPDEWCNPDGVCETLPVLEPAGTVTVTGLDAPASTSPNPDGTYPAVHLSRNAFGPASTVTAAAPGDQTPGFNLTVQGVDFIDPPLQCQQALPPAGQDLVFSWTPAGDGSWVRFYLPVYNHGGLSPTVLCEVPESRGSLTVPAAMIDHYLAAGADIRRTYDISRFNLAVVDVGGGRGVGFHIQAKRECDFFH